MSKNNYSIGQVLKNVRKELGLTQKQMCGNIVTPTYYSKVENGKTQISARALFKILSLHNYDINKFYNRLNPNNSGNSAPFWSYTDKLVTIANSRNATDFAKISQELKEMESSNIEGIDTLKLLLAVADMMIKGTNQGVSEDSKKLAKKLIRGRDGKSYVYLLLQTSIMMFDVDEGYALMMEAIKYFNQSENNFKEDEFQLAAAATSYVKLCWEKKVDKKYVVPMIKFVKDLPLNSKYIGLKLFLDYYESLFNHEEKKVELIGQILKDSGAYTVIANTLKDDKSRDSDSK